MIVAYNKNLMTDTDDRLLKDIHNQTEENIEDAFSEIETKVNTLSTTNGATGIAKIIRIDRLRVLELDISDAPLGNDMVSTLPPQDRPSETKTFYGIDSNSSGNIRVTDFGRVIAYSTSRIKGTFTWVVE